MTYDACRRKVIETYGFNRFRITRPRFARLCELPDDVAKRFYGKMKDEGIIERYGYVSWDLNREIAEFDVRRQKWHPGTEYTRCGIHGGDLILLNVDNENFVPAEQVPCGVCGDFFLYGKMWENPENETGFWWKIPHHDELIDPAKVVGWCYAVIAEYLSREDRMLVARMQGE